MLAVIPEYNLGIEMKIRDIEAKQKLLANSKKLNNIYLIHSSNQILEE